MSAIAIDFEMTDALVAQAVREDCVAFAREHISRRDFVIVIASTCLFALAILRESHWIWWFSGLPAVLLAVAGVTWLAYYLRSPRTAQARLAHLANRHVHIETSATSLSFATASERLEVAWDELKALKRRPSFWVVALRSGTRIPIPAHLLTAEAIATFQARLQQRAG